MSKEMMSTSEVPHDSWMPIQASIIEMAIPEHNNEKRSEWAELHGKRCRDLWDQRKDAEPKLTPAEMAGMILQTIREEEDLKKIPI